MNLQIQKLIQLRRTLHAHPELSGQEQHTAARIESYLRQLQPDALLVGLGGHGIVATFDSGQPGPAILLRSELDALPIAEINNFEHRSTVSNVSHKCGHDGHSAILCGLAEVLAAQRPPRGKVHVLFQPAEETGEGAAAVLQDAGFADVHPDFGIALHNFPGLPMHTVFVKDGIFTAAVGSLIICFAGRTAHASEPEQGLNPTLAVADLLRACAALNRPDANAADFQLITPVHVRVGSPAYGVSAGDGEVHLTLRSWSSHGLESLKAEVCGLAEELASRDGLGFNTQSLQTFYANENDPQLADCVRQATREMGLPLIEATAPVRGGEDFGLFTTRFPCCMFGLGAGEDTTPLHSPDYDFPDALIETGVRVFLRIVQNLLTPAPT
jgi:amidohydrolase